MEQRKNTGLNLDLELKQQSERDWVYLGSMSPKCESDIPKEIIENYLPAGEVQRGLDDTMDCASRSPHNILETKLNYLYKTGKLIPECVKFLEESGFITERGIEISDAFTAILSHTTRNGNSLIAPLDSLNNNGFAPKKLLPLLPTMTFEEYMNPDRITKKLIQIGLESKKWFPVSYERVGKRDFESVLEHDLVATGGYAWPEPVNGEYPAVDSRPNHAFMAFNLPRYHIFDNYIDEDGDFIKKLAPDYELLDFGYRVFFIEIKKTADVPESFISRLIKSIIEFFTKRNANK